MLSSSTYFQLINGVPCELRNKSFQMAKEKGNLDENIKMKVDSQEVNTLTIVLKREKIVCVNIKL